MRVLYMCTHGSSDPTKASIPWHLAVNGSAEIGHSVTVFLAGDAAETIIPATRDSLEGVGVPPLRELIAKAREKSVAIHV